jgi:aldehyde dehydrogenase (NAD+)
MSSFQNLFEAQKALFATNVTRTYEWRIEQLDRMGRMIKENEAALQSAIARDFKTASQEYIFETVASFAETEFQKSQLKAWMAPTEAPAPRALAESGHRGVVFRDPYGVALIIGPFNGPLTLLIRPAITALAAGNTCILKLSSALSATSAVLLELVPKYRSPGGRRRRWGPRGDDRTPQAAVRFHLLHRQHTRGKGCRSCGGGESHASAP